MSQQPSWYQYSYLLTAHAIGRSFDQTMVPGSCLSRNPCTARTPLSERVECAPRTTGASVLTPPPPLDHFGNVPFHKSW
eukprot:3773082-Pleurochrysis_carterae.AAC.8